MKNDAVARLEKRYTILIPVQDRSDGIYLCMQIPICVNIFLSALYARGLLLVFLVLERRRLLTMTMPLSGDCEMMAHGIMW